MSRPTCRNRVTGVDVEDQLCNETQRPDMQVIQCNMIKCPAKWVNYTYKYIKNIKNMITRLKNYAGLRLYVMT